MRRCHLYFAAFAFSECLGKMSQRFLFVAATRFTNRKTSVTTSDKLFHYASKRNYL